MQSKSFLWVFLLQFKALIKKTVLLRYNSLVSTIFQILQACIFVLIIWIINWAITNSNERMEALRNTIHPPPTSVSRIPDCSDDIFLKKSLPCYTLLYSPKDDLDITMVMNGIIRNNQPPISDEKIKGFNNMAEVDEFLLQNPESVLAAVHFFKENNKRIGYVLQTNTSTQFFKGRYKDPNYYIQLPLQLAVEREIVKHLSNDNNLKWDVSFTRFSHPKTYFESLVTSITPIFLLASSIINYVILLGYLVTERETGMIQALHNMGLLDSAFWASLLFSEVIMCVVHAAMITITAVILNISIFTMNSISLVAFLVFLLDVSLTSLAFLTSGFIKHNNSAVPFGFGVFVFAWIMHMSIQSGFPYISYFPDYTRIPFNIFPWTIVSKAFGDLAKASWHPDGGIYWSNLDSYCVTYDKPSNIDVTDPFILYNCVVSISTILKYLGYQALVYFVIAIYFYNVIPDNYGVKKSPFYFLSHSYWLPTKNISYKKLKMAYDKPLEENQGIMIDHDVKRERNKLRRRCKILFKENERSYIDNSGSSSSSLAVSEESSESSESLLTQTPRSSGREKNIGNPVLELFNLRKKFGKFIAVEGTWLGIDEGECFCLLGPNGAGKTTTINCLTGMLSPDGGDALVYGESICSPGGLNAIRSFMGVCPQFDILWNNLTGKEHLELFADIKGISQKNKKTEIETLLEQVKLKEASDLMAGTYSGGMRRRLSVAIALLANPKIVYLDEPTTGMDPISRRHVWDLIDKAKEKRVIILTTHSMEEADMLGDRIGIMARGRLRCLGNGLRLKARFGSGYKMSISVKEKRNSSEGCNRVKEIMKNIMSIDVSEESDAYMHFIIPKDKENEMTNLFNILNKNKNIFKIQDIQLSLTPLEEVFLKVAQQAELEYSKSNGIFVDIKIAEENVTVKVPLGAESVKVDSGSTYTFQWRQDINGTLALADYSLVMPSFDKQISINTVQSHDYDDHLSTQQ